MLFEDCPELSQFLTKSPRTKDDIEFLNARQCSYTEGEYIVCCVEPKRNLEKDVTETTKLPIKYLPSAPLCGIDLHDALDGGNDAQICESPWTALLQYTYRKFHIFE